MRCNICNKAKNTPYKLGYIKFCEGCMDDDYVDTAKLATILGVSVCVILATINKKEFKKIPAPDVTIRFKKNDSRIWKMESIDKFIESVKCDKEQIKELMGKNLPLYRIAEMVGIHVFWVTKCVKPKSCSKNKTFKDEDGDSDSFKNAMKLLNQGMACV